MDISLFLHSDLFNWVILPLLIFLARVIDVSIGTIRVIFVSRGYKLLAAILGFFEVLIWIAAVRQILFNMTNIFGYIAYAGGFATGTYVGIVLEDKISVGKVMIRIIARKKTAEIIRALRKAGYSLTIMDGEGKKGRVKVINMFTDRENKPHIIEIVRKIHPTAFYTVQDVRYAYEDGLPTHHRRFRDLFHSHRKGK